MYHIINQTCKAYVLTAAIPSPYNTAKVKYKMCIVQIIMADTTQPHAAFYDRNKFISSRNFVFEISFVLSNI